MPTSPPSLSSARAPWGGALLVPDSNPSTSAADGLRSIELPPPGSMGNDDFRSDMNILDGFLLRSFLAAGVRPSEGASDRVVDRACERVGVRGVEKEGGGELGAVRLSPLPEEKFASRACCRTGIGGPRAVLAEVDPRRGLVRRVQDFFDLSASAEASPPVRLGDEGSVLALSGDRRAVDACREWLDVLGLDEVADKGERRDDDEEGDEQDRAVKGDGVGKLSSAALAKDDSEGDTLRGARTGERDCLTDFDSDSSALPSLVVDAWDVGEEVPFSARPSRSAFDPKLAAVVRELAEDDWTNVCWVTVDRDVLLVLRRGSWESDDWRKASRKGLLPGAGTVGAACAVGEESVVAMKESRTITGACGSGSVGRGCKRVRCARSRRARTSFEVAGRLEGRREDGVREGRGDRRSVRSDK